MSVASLEPRRIEDLLELGADELALERYAYGAHFVSFLIAEYGEDAVMSAMSEPSYPDALSELFERHLGESLDRIDERWRSEAWDTVYFTRDPCDELVDLGDGYEASAVIDCGSAETLGHVDSTLFGWPQRRCLSIPEVTEVSISTWGGPGRVTLHGHDCDPEDIKSGSAVGRTIPAEPGQEIVLDETLGRCRWWLDFRADWPDAPVELGIVIEPR